MKTKRYLRLNIHEKPSPAMAEFAQDLMKDYYLKPNEDIPEAFARAVTGFCFGDYALAQRLYDAVYKGWWMFSSPILSNAPKISWPSKYFKANRLWLKHWYKPHTKVRGLPISCFLTYVPDTIEGQFKAAEELCRLSVAGGGVGQHLKMRGVTDKAPGAIPFMKTSDSNIMYYKQGKTRKGAVAVYLDIHHPDIAEFIVARKATGGDPNRKTFNLHNAVNITTKFLTAVRKDLDWELIAPDTQEVVEVVKARSLWEGLLDTRYKTGEPYLNYIDEANYKMPQELKNLGLTIHGSNLCNEIHLPTDEKRTAVCCLSSVNLAKYKEWEGSTLVADMVTFLDNVLEYFIHMAPKSLEKAVYSAKHSRDIGIGAMGWHQLLQQEQIPFESGGFSSAIQLTNTIFKDIKERAKLATKKLGKTRGPCLDSKTVRNMHLLAIAPNANSSILCGCSPSIEPWKANSYVHRTRMGSTLVLNPALQEYFEGYYDTTPLPEEAKEKWIAQQWEQVTLNNGSVAGLAWMSPIIKKVFKTAAEIDQKWVVLQARHRQQYLCQGQSINLNFPSGATKAEVNKVHLLAFSLGSEEGTPLKGLYYLRTEALRKGEAVSTKVVEDKMLEFEEKEPSCLSCEG